MTSEGNYYLDSIYTKLCELLDVQEQCNENLKKIKEELEKKQKDDDNQG